MSQQTLEAIQLLVRNEIGFNPDVLSEFAWQSLIRQEMKQFGLDDLKAYFFKLKQSRNCFQRLIQAVSIPETWFFREERGFAFLEEFVRLRPELKKPLRLLCLPCSTGEEAYSLAITLLKSGLAPSEFMIEACDINEASLEIAERGVYRRRSFRGSYPEKGGDFFIREGDLWVVKERVKQSVYFRVENLLDRALVSHSKPFRLIFCRNLLMYLTRTHQIRALKQLKRLLEPQGCLIVGEAECYSLIESEAQLEAGPYSFVYTAFSSKDPGGSESPQKRGKGTPDPPKELQAARELADSGRFLEAERAAYVYLEERGLHPEAYFLLGLVQHALGNTGPAQNFFEKTVYLQPNHREALIYLSLLSSKRTKAELYWKRAEKGGEV